MQYVSLLFSQLVTWNWKDMGIAGKLCIPISAKFLYIEVNVGLSGRKGWTPGPSQPVITDLTKPISI